ncbi:hypothetical protein JVU11DRAFT_2297 [Chiua virens]|nr:hypothetical protein JVU11DRAFT_2297 [Chiua virens]
MPEIQSLNQLISHRVRECPDLQLLAVPDKNLNYIKYTTAELDAAASLLANHLRDTGALPGRAKGDATSRLTIGLLGVSNIDYVVTEMTLYRMGYCVLFLSPNNSPPAIAHLLTVTNASHIIVQDSLLSPATAALSHLADPSSVSIIHQPPSDVFGPNARVSHPDKTHWDPPLSPDVEFLLPITIIHSSGSTGFPKPIIQTNKAAIGNCKMNFGLTSLTTLPLYHGHGHSNLLRAWYAAKPLYLFPTGSIPLTSANVIRVLSQAPDIEALYGVPFALKLLAETQEGLRVLKSLKLVTFGGSACPDELGDFLVSEGVPLVGHYGLTEMGQLMTSFRDFDTDKEWNWYTNICVLNHYGNDTYELYILNGWHTKASLTHILSILFPNVWQVMSNQPDGSYATKDLFLKHPTILDAYKYIGRIDDTLVMVNGEKTNPVPIELTLRSSSYIAEAIVFGTWSHPNWRSHTPHGSRSTLVARRIHSSRRLDRRSRQRRCALAFPAFGRGTSVPALWDVHSEGGQGEYFAAKVEKQSDELGDDTDLFDFGLDSLAVDADPKCNSEGAEIDLDGKKLSINAVFEHPSITKLAKLVLSLSSGKDTDALHTNPQKLMIDLVDKYSRFKYPLEMHTNSSSGDRTTNSKVVVLTGATGSLGSYILNELLADPNVETVYCLCRATTDADAADRLAASMKMRKLSTHFHSSAMSNEVNERVVALAADLPANSTGPRPDVLPRDSRAA